MSKSRLGLWSTAALVVGHTIAVGIFLTPAQLIGALASPAWTLGLWLACGALVFAGALTFGELASRYPRSGGLYVYLREAYGPRAAFLYGWQALLIMDPGITAAIAVGLSQYVAVIWPATAGHERAVALGAIWAFALVNMAGLRFSARVLNLLAAFKVLALAAIVGVAFLAGSGSLSHFSPFAARRAGAPPIADALGLGLVAVFFSFGGFWEASRVADEVRDPETTLPRALAVGVATVTLAYVGVTAAMIYLVPIGKAGTATELARRAGEAMLGRAGPAALAAVVILSVAGSAMALLFMAPRLSLAMARDGLFPPVLAARNPRTGAPVRATTLLAAIASLLVVSGSFDQIVAFFLCTALAFVAFAASALFVARRRGPGGRFLAPGYPATPALFVLFLALVVLCIALARPGQVLAGFVLVLLGVPAYRFFSPEGALPASENGGAR